MSSVGDLGTATGIDRRAHPPTPTPPHPHTHARTRPMRTRKQARTHLVQTTQQDGQEQLEQHEGAQHDDNNKVDGDPRVDCLRVRVVASTISISRLQSKVSLPAG